MPMSISSTSLFVTAPTSLPATMSTPNRAQSVVLITPSLDYSMQKPLDIARSKNLSAIVKALEEAEGKSDNSTLSTPFKPTAASSSAAHVVPVGSSSEPSQMAPPRTSVNESAMATMSVAVHQLAQDANAMETTTVSAGRSSLKRAGGADTTSIDAGSKPKKVRVNSNPEWLAPVAAETAAGPSSTAAAADHEPLTKSSSNLYAFCFPTQKSDFYLFIYLFYLFIKKGRKSTVVSNG